MNKTQEALYDAHTRWNELRHENGPWTDAHLVAVTVAHAEYAAAFALMFAAFPESMDPYEAQERTEIIARFGPYEDDCRWAEGARPQWPRHTDQLDLLHGPRIAEIAAWSEDQRSETHRLGERHCTAQRSDGERLRFLVAGDAVTAVQGDPGFEKAWDA